MAATKDLAPGVLFGIGHPIVDITANVDEYYLHRYNLKPDDMILAEDSHEHLYAEVAGEYEVQYTAGGATQNTIRVAQYYLDKPHSTTYVGCIGQDEIGTIMRRCMKEEGINTAYLVSETAPTGCCAVLITGEERSLVTRLGAAQLYLQEHLESPVVWKHIKQATCIYSAGYFLNTPGANDIMLKVAKYAAMNDKTFCTNLSATFLCQYFKQQLLAVLPYTDILFGNKEEALKFANEMNYETSNLEAIVRKIAEIPTANTAKSRVVVITCGGEPAVVCRAGQVSHYPVVPIDPGRIVDTNGAGDAFVGGFLAKYVLDCTFEECMRSANTAANMIIQQIGCTLPDGTL